MSKRLEVEMDGNLKEMIAEYAKRKGLRLPFAYGELLKCGLREKIKEEKSEES